MSEGYYDNIVDRYERYYNKWLFNKGINKLFIINKINHIINNKYIDDIEDYIGKICKYYISEVYSCCICNKAYSSNKGYEVNGEYEINHVCSKRCGREEIRRQDKYYETERKMAEEYEKYISEEREREPTISEIEAMNDYINSGRADEEYERNRDNNQRVLRRNNL
jgi:hypothetical protein